MTKKQNTVVWEGWCSVDIPKDWTWSEDAGVISIFNETEGVGVLQISFASRPQLSIPTSEEAVTLSQSFAKSQNWMIDASTVKVTRSENSLISAMVYCTSDEEPTLWKVWHMVERSRVASITYNSAQEDKDIESGAVISILG